MPNLSPSLFTRLYITIFFVVFGSLLLTKLATEAYYEQEEFQYFKRDSHSIFNAINNDFIKNNSPDKFIPSVPFPYDRDYIAKLRHVPPGTLCKRCRLITADSLITYFELKQGEHAAQHQLRDNLSVLISEKTDEQRGREEHLHLEDVIYEIMVIMAAILIALALYWPISALQSQIKELIASHRQFGNGKMHARANVSIQKPLDQLARSFNHMADSISDSVKESEVFAHAIPHEVRTPLSRIQLAAGLIRQQQDSEQVVEMLDNIDKYVIDINQLINQIVEFSKLNRQDIDQHYQHFESIDVIEFVEQRLAILASDTNKTVNIDAPSPVEFTTNPVYLRLLVDNFIKNALSHAQSKVTLAISCNTQNPLQISVSDDGPGIDEHERESVFMPFSRLDKSRSRKTGGLGLGLAIAKAAGRKMQGEITITTSPLSGAQFTFKQPSNCQLPSHLIIDE